MNRKHLAALGGSTPAGFGEEPSARRLVERFCLRDNLATWDPYDLWKTRLGAAVKDFYNHHPELGLGPAAILTLYDMYVNNRRRWLYRRQEYPIVRAMAVLSLLNLHRASPHRKYLDSAKAHLDWLASHPCSGYNGAGWGLGFPYAVKPGVSYDDNTPLSTITPYCLEAFLQYGATVGDGAFGCLIPQILQFFDKDIVVMQENDQWLATSYAPWRDRIVINAVSYTMYSLSLLLPHTPTHDKSRLEHKIGKLWRFVQAQQHGDGSWLYSPEGRPFVDCFHSCIVLKNIFKTNRNFPLRDSAAVIERGYAYLKNNFVHPELHLCRRFSKANKPGIIRFDLYDNAEMLNLAILLGDGSLATRLLRSIDGHFRTGAEIYSVVDIFGRKWNKDMLRWAVMPYLHALSQIAL
ncbi:MAG: hypothetical protein RBS80_17770 [Thermoguttaceae bacterium]|jgi:hypothetical protein|nr:hypothetical protein [Thermoguttaceae bacterium]